MIKKITPWIVFFLLIALLVIGFNLKDNMSRHISNIMKAQVPTDLSIAKGSLIDSLYNYSENGLNYEITFLEFGTTGCVACRKMEQVMQEVKLQFPEKVNVVFINVSFKENLSLMMLFGVSAIPTQILLDKSGKEYFRHTGYFSLSEISKKFDDMPINK